MMALSRSSVIILVFSNLAIIFVKSHELMRVHQEPTEDNCEGFTCIRKCCPADMYVNITFCDTPVNHSLLWQPVFHDASTLIPVTEPLKNLQYLYGIVQCEAFHLRPSVNPDDNFYLLQDGKLHIPFYKKNYSPDKYCVDNFATNIKEAEEMALLCFEEEENKKPNKFCQEIKTYLYPLLLMISCVFLTITLLVYICIPELHGKLHGRCLMSLVSSLLVAYVFTFIVTIASEEMYPTACLICATVKYFTLLASFLWLNVVCFDIWRSLRSLRPSPAIRSTSRKRFCLYSLYAWGSSFFLSLVAIIIDTRPDSFNKVIRPNFVNDRRSCWFDGRKSLWYYFYTIVVILLVVNLFFFVHVICIILRSQTNKELQAARSQNRDRLWLYGKLFLVMGISWIFEVISWHQRTCEAWIITDIVNALQGFIIFLVFVCKKSTRQLVNRRIPRNVSFSKSSRSAVSGTTRLTMSSISRNRERRAVTNPPESRSLMEPVATSTSNDVTDVREEGISDNVSSTPNGQSYPPGLEEDCPSIHGDSVTSEAEGTSSPEKSSMKDQDLKDEELNDQTHPQGLNTENTEIVTNNEEARDSAVGNELKSEESPPSDSELELHLLHEDNLELSGERRLSTSSIEESLPLMIPQNQEAEPAAEKSEIGPRENSPLLSEGNERLGSSGEIRK